MKKIIWLLLLLPVFASAQLELPYSIKMVNARPVDYYYYNTSFVPYTGAAQIKSQVPAAARYRGQTFFTQDSVEYWFKSGTADSDLVAKGTGASSYTAGNGLTLSSSNFKLGGTLTENTSIYVGALGLTLQGSMDIENTAGTGKLSFNDSQVILQTDTEDLLIIPSGDVGTAGQALVTDGTGKTSWETIVGSGSITDVSIVTANGFAGSVADSLVSPNITIKTTVSGILKGDGTAISPASAGTDYEVPLTFSTGLTRSTNTVTVNTTQNITNLSNLSTKGLVTTTAAGLLSSTQGTGFIKDNGAGVISYDNSTYITSNVSANELLMSNGTNAIHSGIFAAGAGNSDIYAAGGTTPNSLALYGGNVTSGNNPGGAASLIGGAGNGTGRGGHVFIRGGVGNSSGAGGDIELAAGDGIGSGNAGNITIKTNAPLGAGSEGYVSVQARTLGKLSFFNATPVVRQSAVSTTQGLADALVAYGLLPSSTISGAGSGTVSSVSVVSANGFAGSVATATTTPTITLSTTITGLLKGNGTSISAASAGTDYEVGGVSWLLASGGTASGTNTWAFGSNPWIVTTGVTTGTGATAGLQFVANSLTTGKGLDVSTSSLTTGNLLSLTSTSTGANDFSLLNINSSGVNANSSRTATGLNISVTNSGTSSINRGIVVTTTGASANVAITATGGLSYTTNAANVVTFGGTFTAGGATDRLVTFSGTLVANSGGGVKSVLFNPSLVASGTSSVQAGISIEPTFSGGTTPINYGLFLRPVAGTVTELARFEYNQNASSAISVVNTTSNTAALAQLLLSNSATLSTRLAISSIPAGYTTSGIAVADVGLINSSKAAGLNMGTNIATQVSLWTNNTQRLSISSGGDARLDAGNFFIANASGDTPTSSTRFEVRGISGGTNIALFNTAANAVVAKVTDTSFDLSDAINLITGTTTGTKFMTATTQKGAFWNATPIVQPANTVAIDDVLINTGLRASGGSANFTLKITNNLPQNLKSYTVGTLPTGVIGDIAYVTDALAPTFLATVVGGGAIITPVFYNGTNWVSY